MTGQMCRVQNPTIAAMARLSIGVDRSFNTAATAASQAAAPAGNPIGGGRLAPD
jgi:hypothetical protein